MSFKKTIDFAKYGIDFTLTPETSRLPPTIKNNVLPVKRDGNSLTFTKNDGSKVDINLVKSLKAGSYGEGWLSDTKLDGTSLVVKIVTNGGLRGDSLIKYEYDVIQEAFIQIIVYEASKDLVFPEIGLSGPFAPRFFLFGKDATNFYIVSELMDGDVDHYVKRDSYPSSGFMKTSCTQIAKILMVLHDSVKYNHRDLKPDNVMYKMIDGKLNIRLIDFGFSCLRYKSLKLSAISDGVYAHRLHCNSNIRDMHQYIFYLYRYSYYAGKRDCPLKKVFEALITNDTYGVGPDTWAETYDKYDFSNANNSPKRAKNASCEVVYNVFSSILLENEDDPCSEITPEWAQHLVKLYDTTFLYLNKYNIEYLNKVLFDSFKIEYAGKNLETLWAENVSGTFLVSEFKFHKTVANNKIEFSISQDKIPALFDMFINSRFIFTNDSIGETILHKIVRLSPTALANGMLDKCLAKVDIYGKKDFVEKKSRVNVTALDIAFDKEYDYAIKKLLKYVSGKKYIISDSKRFNNFMKANGTFLRGSDLQDTLCEAAREPKANHALKVLLSKLSTPVLCNGKDELLDVAIKANNIEGIKLLLEAGYSVNYDNFLLNLRFLKDGALIDRLIDKFKGGLKKDVVKGLHTTPLHMAVIYNNLPLVRRMVDLPGVLVSARDSYGRTCLHYASELASGKTNYDDLIKESIKYDDNYMVVAFNIVKLLVNKYPALADIKDLVGKGPGNPMYAIGEVRSFIKSKKSGIFKRNPNTEKSLRKGGRKTRRRRI